MTRTLRTNARDTGKQCEHILRQCPEIFLIKNIAHHCPAPQSSISVAVCEDKRPVNN